MIYSIDMSIRSFAYITMLACMGVFPIITRAQNAGGEKLRMEQYAKQEIQKSIKENKERPLYDTLISDKETAIAVVEPILFKTYGKDHIIGERPYETYFFKGYWYISGRLPQGYFGGTFEIIINSINGQVIKLNHGK